MIKKILNYIKNDIKNNYISYILFILIVPTFFIKLDYNIYSPGGLISLEDRIETDNKYIEEGSFNDSILLDNARLKYQQYFYLI